MKAKSGPWKVIEESYYERFAIFDVKKSRRLNPRTNSTFDFCLVDALDWVNVLAVTENNELVLVEQYRHGAEEWGLEFPGGVVERHESDVTLSASRELREETGYEASDVQLIGSVRPNPAMFSNKLHVCLARDVKLSGTQSLDAGEDIRVILRPLSSLKEMIATGQIQHALMLAAVSLIEARGVNL